MNSSEYDVDIIQKIVLIGDSGVGKSNLITRFTKDEFNIESKATIGVEFATKVLTVQSSMVKTQIWDTAGQERFQSLGVAFYRGADVCVLVYDVTSAKSFASLDNWRDEFLVQVRMLDSCRRLVGLQQADKQASCRREGP